MGKENISSKAAEAMKHLRNFVMHNGKMPSVRELMRLMNYKSPLSATLLLNELYANEFLEKKSDGTYTLIKDLKGDSIRTVSVPLLGSVACGTPMFADENIEAMVAVSTKLAKAGSKYYLLRAKGDSMNKAGINHGDLILVKQQPTAVNGDTVVALIDDEATVKEIQKRGDFVKLIPKSSNPVHQPIILTRDFQIQGVVVATIPK